MESLVDRYSAKILSLMDFAQSIYEIPRALQRVSLRYTLASRR